MGAWLRPNGVAMARAAAAAAPAAPAKKPEDDEEEEEAAAEEAHFCDLDALLGWLLADALFLDFAAAATAAAFLAAALEEAATAAAISSARASAPGFSSRIASTALSLALRFVSRVESEATVRPRASDFHRTRRLSAVKASTRKLVEAAAITGAAATTVAAPQLAAAGRVVGRKVQVALVGFQEASLGRFAA